MPHFQANHIAHLAVRQHFLKKRLTAWRNENIIKLQFVDTPIMGGMKPMYENLLGQKTYFHLTDEDMGNIIGVSRNAYSQKIRSGKFRPSECQAFCKYFHKSFEYLFATERDTREHNHQ